MRHPNQHTYSKKPRFRSWRIAGEKVYFIIRAKDYESERTFVVSEFRKKKLLWKRNSGPVNPIRVPELDIY